MLNLNALDVQIPCRRIACRHVAAAAASLVGCVLSAFLPLLFLPLTQRTFPFNLFTGHLAGEEPVCGRWKLGETAHQLLGVDLVSF